ncbi:MAG: sulfatase-like hydrolase/transferase, partial [Draconibacterium sp.]|nr:sulfatase-like hydrolase/transferase [Draconibacterium sp.]
MAGVNVFAKQRPNIILIMTDDQGWGQTGYYNHPILKTPNLDEMAENGLRFDRFYAGAPVCSPTRASVLTGRACHRTGVFQHGYPLRKQEKVLPRVLKDLGYATAHFGKWHLNGLRGPGAPVFGDDTHSPGEFGFQYWLTVSNFFDINPIMSRNGKFEEFEGTSSEIIVGEALNFIEAAVEKEQPFFTVIWDGSPHDPMVAKEEDMKGFEHLNTKSKHHYGELVAFDRSLGKLRKRLRELQIEKNTILWFCSDNGGLPKIEPETVGGFR